MNKYLIALAVLSTSLLSFAQKNPNPGYWQQRANYQMDVDMNVNTFTYQGTQKLTYFNNSPDTLKSVYFHLYYNAFQPGSDMDALLQSIPDPSMEKPFLKVEFQN